MITNLNQLAMNLRQSRGFAHKRDIANVMMLIDSATTSESPFRNGDDCAVLPSPFGDGYLLLAVEGLVQDFVKTMPWFAGYSGVMANLSDIAAMGGRASAVVDALWASSWENGAEIMAGIKSASERYGVPLVGGHTNLRSEQTQLAVSVLGYANKIISSFEAKEGDHLIVAIDLRGKWMDPYPFWNASTNAPTQRLRADIALLPGLADDGLCQAGKDISMAGVLGTMLMMLECSGVGAQIEVDRIPVPHDQIVDNAGWLRWLCAFPSFGYILSVSPSNVETVRRRFIDRGIACEDVGVVVPNHQLHLTAAGHTQDCLLWDLDVDPFIGVNTVSLSEA